MVVGKIAVASSTPAKKRLTIIEPDCFSPLRRKSLAVTTSPRVHVDNDDEAERSRRRNDAELQRRISCISSPAQNVSSPGPQSLSESSGINLQDQFDTCLRMYMQNKINAKNAWNLHIIEYMRAFIKSNVELRSMLQVAGTSLDIGAKIYSLRVDDVHSETLRLANTLIRVNLKGREDTSNEPDAEEGEEEEERAGGKKEKQRKKQRNLDNNEKRVTVCEQEENLNGVVSKHSGFYGNQCGNSSDSSSLLNMTLLKRQSNFCELLVKARSTESKLQVGSRTNEEQTAQYVVPLEPLVTSTVCPPFHGFTIDLWDVDHEEEFNRSRLNDEVVFNENGIPIPDLDAENLDPNEDALDDDFITEDVEFGPQAHHGPVETVFITDMRPNITDKDSGRSLEYSYRPVPSLNERFNLDGVWAGPSHWKPKCLRRPSKGEVKNPQEKCSQKRLRPVVEPITLENTQWSVIQKILQSSKKPTTRKTVSNFLELCTLPEDMLVTTDCWMKLSLLPRRKVKFQHTDSQLNDMNVSNYVYDNPDDNEYCSQTVGEDNWNNEDNNVADEDPMPPETQSQMEPGLTNGLDDDGLVAEPDLVPQNFVAYAHKAKKMDMKKLKTLMWEEITAETNHKKHKNTREEGVNSTTLHKVYDKIPSKMSQMMAENLSCPLAFVALLHLANEHSLILRSNETLTDILISRPTE